MSKTAARSTTLKSDYPPTSTTTRRTDPAAVSSLASTDGKADKGTAAEASFAIAGAPASTDATTDEGTTRSQERSSEKKTKRRNRPGDIRWDFWCRFKSRFSPRLPFFSSPPPPPLLFPPPPSPPPPLPLFLLPPPPPLCANGGKESISPTSLLIPPLDHDDDDDDPGAFDDVEVGVKVASLRAELEQYLACASRLSERLLTSTVQRVALGEGAESSRDVLRNESVSILVRIQETVDKIDAFDALTEKSRNGPGRLDADANAARAQSLLLVLELDREMSDRATFESDIKEREREVRRAKKREAEEREKRREASEAQERWPDEQRAVQAEIDTTCRHYKRHCLVSFGDCCGEGLVFGCQHCHNESSRCPETKLNSRDATHLECRTCGKRQEIGPESSKCEACQTPTAEYFCAICRLFDTKKRDPYHCDRCETCRIKGDDLFHCDACDICLHVRVKGKHKCKPDRQNDDCGICLEKLTSSYGTILPCGHALHIHCIKLMIANGSADRCPMCRQSI